MGAEQADGLMNQENKPTLTEILSSTDEQTTSETNKNQNLTQYYYERKEINTSNKKFDNKENLKEEPDSTTIIGNRVIQIGKPTTIYEKRVISKTIKREGNINNNTTTTTTQTRIIKTENYTNKEQQVMQNEKIKKEIIKDNSDDINTNDTSVNSNKINNINNSIVKKNVISYNNPPVKIMHRNIIANKNFRQKNFLPKTNINVNKSSNYFIPSTNIISNNNTNYNTNPIPNPNPNNNQLPQTKSSENLLAKTNTPNKLLISTSSYRPKKLQLKKIELPTNPTSQRSQSPDINSVRRKTINRGEEIKNVQITHIICSSKNNNKSPDFHITEKLSTQGIKSTPLTITIQDREKLKKGGKSTYKSSCTEPRPIPKENLRGKTTVFQHVRGIGMTNDRRNSNSSYYTSDIKKFDPIMIKKEKEKVEHVENFRSSKYRNGNSNNNSIDVVVRREIGKKKIGNETNKDKEINIVKVNDENVENNNGNIVV